MKGYRYKLLQRGYPKEHKNWFNYDAAVEFEETVFINEAEANERLIELCREFDTDSDPNFSAKRPLVLTEEAWKITMGEDADLPFSWY